jgi:hypothetical protein
MSHRKRGQGRTHLGACFRCCRVHGAGGYGDQAPGPNRHMPQPLSVEVALCALCLLVVEALLVWRFGHYSVSSGAASAAAAILLTRWMNRRFKRTAQVNCWDLSVGDSV